ncbi:hypothetical protein BDA96_07G203000 [Sorghum bicolor]|jgi:steroid 5-alpha reductase family enzyme|uniref:Secreted protein n=2 Tax=Sorghum bicolor TaxID=4558 RepID=A0A921QQ51_SORBI|nr:hypothetical protein BDA96_07G203000 [Sorghum bicolor]KXG25519.1 hypothetical protein SORBI_3007G191000 [Sorghum bicolor]
MTTHPNFFFECIIILVLLKVHFCEWTHHSTSFLYLLLPVSGEPFINGEAVPYDPTYHEEWLRSKARSCPGYQGQGGN